MLFKRVDCFRRKPRPLLPLPQRRRREEPPETQQEVPAPPPAPRWLHHVHGHIQGRAAVSQRVHGSLGQRLAAQLPRTAANPERAHRADNEFEFLAKRPVRGVGIRRQDGQSLGTDIGHPRRNFQGE